jgi:Zn-dependent peptidase ImmA (M78 family)
LRTLAHELVHLAQANFKELTPEDGVTGSDVENEANALAGILMRLWNQADC